MPLTDKPGPLAGYKTYVTSLVTIITAWAAWAVGGEGGVTLATAIELTVLAVLASTVRHGVKTDARKVVPMLAAVMLLTTAAGCPSTPPATRYYQAQEGFIAVVTTLTAARQAGHISDDVWSKALPLINAGDGLLDDAEAAILSGDRVRADQILGHVRTLTRQLHSFQLEVDNESGPAVRDRGGDAERPGVSHPSGPIAERGAYPSAA